VITGVANAGTTYVWNSTDNRWDEYPIVRYTGVTVNFDTGEVASATSSDPDWQSWSAIVTLTRLGFHNATATGEGTETVSTPLLIIAGVPSLTVNSPAPGASVPLSETGADIIVSATTTDSTWFAGLEVQVQSDGGTQKIAPVSGSTTQFSGSVHLQPMPLGNRSVTVAVVCTNAPLVRTTQTVTVVGQDAAPPHVIVTQPPQSWNVVPDPATMTVQILGTANDTQSGMSGGRAGIALCLSATGARTPALPATPGDWSSWSARVSVPTLGSFTLYVWATDAAGNIAPPLAWPFEAVSSYVPQTLADRLSELEYLSALTNFARDQVNKEPGVAVSSPDLAQAIHQPLDKIVVPLTAAAAAGQVPANELRVPIEILRSHIADEHVSTSPGAQLEASYLLTAYDALLSGAGVGGAGTSYVEMRLTRGADDTTRKALAARLGISLYGPSGSPTGRPDQLDLLTLDGAALTEAALESLFGLPATTAGLDPLRTIGISQLLTWQLAAQSSAWQSEDAAPPAPVTYVVLVDPDIITSADVLVGSSSVGLRALDLLRARSQALANQANALNHALGGAADAPSKLAAILAVGVPGVKPTFLTDLQTSESQGNDISAQLAAAGLDRAGYTYLLRLQTLAGIGTGPGLVTATEWADAIDVFVGAFRRRQYSTWAAQESGIILSPDIFTNSGAGPSLSRFRIDPRARMDWQNVLRTRSGQRQELVEGSSGMVAAAEKISLPTLRDALLADVAAGVGGDAGEWMTGLYLIDFKASGSLQTTRLAEATASLQTLLELVRSGDVSKDSPAHGWKLSHGDTFDAAWTWIGGINSWRYATTAFLFPEAALDPALLNPNTNPNAGSQAAFGKLCEALLVGGDFAPGEVITAVDTYCHAVDAGNWLGVPNPGALKYLSSRDRGHQAILEKWSNSLDNDNTKTGLEREIFWAVPMLAAQRLHIAGHHQAALDWFWVVYPYNDPLAVSSYHKINKEASDVPTQPDLSFLSNWTSNLDPFHLINGRPAPYLRNTLLAIIATLADYGDAEFTTDSDESIAHARTLYLTAAQLLAHPRLTPVPPSNPGEAALPIPQFETLTTRVGTQLAKLRQGRNIAGLPRTQTMTTGDPISQPTPYYFRVLLARAQQLNQQAITVEAEYLSLLEKYDNKRLQTADARNAADVAAGQLLVHAAQVQEAQDAGRAAQAQLSKATAMVSAYQVAIDAGPNKYETALLGEYRTMRNAQDVIAGAEGAIALAQNAASSAAELLPTLGGSAITGGVVEAGIYTKMGTQMWLNNVQSQMQANQLQAGIEARKQEWAIQQASAAQDVLVATAQQKVATDQVTIATAEKDVAQMQSDQANATLALLQSQFTNADLYKWMSDTLGGVYRYFLQQATATSRLAQDQLAFERGEPAKAFIRTDYWQSPGRLTASASSKGMTGAERLLKDLSQLDQYAFSTDSRRLNLSQTFSLAQLLPVEFLGLRATGGITFATPMSWFDQDFPGHYQRLIRRIHVSVVALVPPTRGIRATLATTGISRVTAPQNSGAFTDIVLRRDPCTVGLTSPVNATGVFELDLQPDMLLPFEGSGVDTTWQFSLPRAANPFDFSSISDVLIGMDYTAMNSFDYQAQVIRRLNGDRNRSSDRVLSLARDFPDQWYALNNPDLTATGRAITLTLRAFDFPASIDSVTTSQVAVRLSSMSTISPVPITLTRPRGSALIGGTATTDAGGIASTRRGADAWRPLLHAAPVGDWQLSFDRTADPLFQAGVLDDLLLIISWVGQAPAWSV